MSWQFDAESGVYKNHDLSSKIREAAVANAICAKFLRPEPGYGKGQGDTVNITRVHNLPLATSVAETELLPTGRPVIDTVSTEVAEWGYAVPLTAKEEDLTHFNLRSRIQTKLRSQMTMTLDKMAADAYKATPVICSTDSATALGWNTSGTWASVGDAAVAFNITHLREIYDYLRRNLLCEPLPNGKYVGLVSTTIARNIKSDPSYAQWGGIAETPVYTGGVAPPVATARLHDVEGFMLFETNHQDALDDELASGLTGEALFFGDDAAHLAVIHDPELRAGLKTNLGRFQDVGWVGMLNAGLTWTAASDTKVVYYGSET